MKRIAILLLALTLTPYLVAADPLYKWVDEQGNVHYSDKPQPGAKKLKLPPASTYTTPNQSLQGESTDPAHQNSDYRALHHKEPPTADDLQAQQQQQTAYAGFVIASPQANEVIWNVTSVTVSVSVQPGFQPGDKVTITVDGKTQTLDGASSATFDDLDRGQHSVSANLQTADGAVLVAQPIIFFIQRATQKN